MNRQTRISRYLPVLVPLVAGFFASSLFAADIGDFLWNSKQAANRLAATVGKAQRGERAGDTAFIYLYYDDYHDIEHYLPGSGEGGDTVRASDGTPRLSDITIEPLPEDGGVRLLSMRFSDGHGNELPQKRLVSQEAVSLVSKATPVRFLRGDSIKPRIAVSPRSPRPRVSAVPTPAVAMAAKTSETISDEGDGPGKEHGGTDSITMGDTNAPAPNGTPAASGFGLFAMSDQDDRRTDPGYRLFDGLRPPAPTPGSGPAAPGKDLKTVPLHLPQNGMPSSTPSKNNPFISSHYKICTEENPAQIVPFGEQ